jgi:LuxR family quorum sensing-dependent transcriptional regulator
MQAWRQALDLATKWEQARSTEQVARGLIAALAPMGAMGFFAGSFPILPFGTLAQIVAGCEVLAQKSPPGWQAAYAKRDLDHGNPVILAPGRINAPFRWSEGGDPRLKGWRGLLLARELGIEDGLAVPCPDLMGRAGVLSVAFSRFQFGPQERRAIQLAAIIAYERMRVLRRNALQAPLAELTARERDCLAFVADGKSESDIADTLGLSTTTVHWHIENAKRKLGAKTRAQAIAKAYALWTS